MRLPSLIVGAIENFMDETTWKWMGIGWWRLKEPIKVYNVNGTENQRGEVIHLCRLQIIYNSLDKLHNFYITNLGKDHLILGYPFLESFNPNIDWKNGQLLDGAVKGQSALFKHLDKLVQSYQVKACKHGPKEDEAVYIRKMTTSQKMADKYWGEEMKDMMIPEEYRKYHQVFLEKEACTFPPDQNPNATINLKPEAPDRINCKVYPLTKDKQEMLCKFLDEELDKGFIEEGLSLYTSPVFFIAKKDSKEKRLVVDYQS